jgi:phosphomannomutase
MTALEAIFKAYDIRGKVKTELTPDLVVSIGKAFSDWLPQSGPVAIGRDMREDSAALAEALIKGIRSQGRDVINVGLVTSDMIYFAIGKHNLAGGAMITASHNASDYNGIKLYRDKVVPVGLDSGLAEIRDQAIGKQFKPSPNSKGGYQRLSIRDDWIKHCLTFVVKLKPFKVAIDAGNGMAGGILPYILPKLPIKAEPLFFELDGSFPNHEANPQKQETLADLIDKVKTDHLDFGIAFDGDGDRVGFVDDLGRPVLGTDLITILSSYYLKKYPGSEIIHEVRTSRATQELIREWGGKPVRTQAGRIIIGRILRQRKAPFGGETTGHLFFRDNFFADSGLIGALVMMQALSDSGKKLSTLVNDYRRYVMTPEINFEVKDKTGMLKIMRSTFKDGEIDELDGLTVNYPDYWFNVRISNTESVIRLNAEAKTKPQLEELIEKITGIIKQTS